jgi:hypothetical protein
MPSLNSKDAVRTWAARGSQSRWLKVSESTRTGMLSDAFWLRTTVPRGGIMALLSLLYSVTPRTRYGVWTSFELNPFSSRVIGYWT